MQDRYAGDVGDFVKLGLLRALSPGKKLGIAWYRFPDEDHNGDGRHISYLSKPELYRHLDPELFDHLSEVVRDERTIGSLTKVLVGIEAFNDSIDLASVPARRRREWRDAWFQRMIDSLFDCDLVFADPDNGVVDDADNRKGAAKYGKQIPVREIQDFARGRSAVIYHHNTRRKGGHNAEVDHWLREFETPGLAVRATAYSPRTFFVLNPDDEMANRVRSFCKKWSVLKVHLHEPTAGD